MRRCGVGSDRCSSIVGARRRGHCALLWFAPPPRECDPWPKQELRWRSLRHIRADVCAAIFGTPFAVTECSLTCAAADSANGGPVRRSSGGSTFLATRFPGMAPVARRRCIGHRPIRSGGFVRAAARRCVRSMTEPTRSASRPHRLTTRAHSSQRATVLRTVRPRGFPRFFCRGEPGPRPSFEAGVHCRP